MKKLISMVLLLATIVGCLSVLPITVSALENGESLVIIPSSNNISATLTEALSQDYYSAQDKINRDQNLKKVVVYKEYEMYANAITGEVYVKNTKTGQIFTTNPYNLSTVNASFSKLALSQLVLKYSETNDASTTHEAMNSYTEAAARGQISMTSIPNGLRVNYTIGDTTKRYVLPASIDSRQLLDLLFVPMMKQMEESINNFVNDNGLSDANVGQYYKTNKNFTFDYSAYALKYKSTYGVTDLFGDEYNTYGNIYAFNKWITEVDKAYAAYYDSLTQNGKKNTMGLSAKKLISELFDDFISLNQVFVLVSAYNLSSYDNPNFDKHKRTWDILDDRLAKYDYLKLNTTEEGGVTYYNNSFFALDNTLTSTQMQYYETIFLTYATNFTIDNVYECEEEVGVTMAESNNAIFKVAIEYTLEDTGVEISVPASSIVFDETKYTIDYLSVLPYLGSGRVDEGGYILYPDGSGVIVDFDDFISSKSTINGNVYGQDYSYYSITGKHQETISMPIYGTVINQKTFSFTNPYLNAPSASISSLTLAPTIYCSQSAYESETYDITFTIDTTSKVVTAHLPYGQTIVGVKNYYSGTKWTNFNTTTTTHASYPTNVTMTVTPSISTFNMESFSKNGYLAIITEGASLAQINLSVNPYSNLNDPYSSIYCKYIPRAKDTYDLSDSLSSIKTSTKFSVFADRKYLGNYTTKIVLLSDDTLAENAHLTSYYSASYVGMAEAYQDYLINQGVLTALTSLKEDLPLYIETFGVMQTLEKFLSIPVEVDVALTSFDDIVTMYEELKDKGISNVKFKLTGYTNGGMESSYPVKLHWEYKAGGKSGFKELLSYVNGQDTGLEIFPNFNFLYIENQKAFDGIILKQVGTKSVDNRYAYRKSYNSVHQEYANDGGMVVVSSMLVKLFNKFNKKYTKLNNDALSIPYLASDVSSDFNEDEYMSREESLNNIISFMQTIRNAGYSSVMSTGGNVYAIQYLDYLLEAPISTSHYNVTSYFVPFWGMVMHSFINYAGTPFNEEANKDEALLRAIESGASLYFILSYDNTSLLKENESLSKYYAVNYKISKDTLIKYYNALNTVIGDLQDYKIVNHETLIVERQLLQSEVESQKQTLQNEFLQQLESQTLLAIEKEKDFIKNVRAFLATPGIDVNVEWDLIDAAETVTTISKFMKNNASNPAFKRIVSATSTSQQWEQFRLAIINGTQVTEFGKTIGVSFDLSAVLASAKVALYTDTLDSAFETQITTFVTEHQNTSADVVTTLGLVEYDSSYSYFTNSEALDEDYVLTTSSVNNSTVRLVTYQKGTDIVKIIVNYNIFAVDVTLDGQTYSISRYGYQRIN